MDWISGLTGLSPGALAVIVLVAFLANIPNVIKLIKVLKDKKIKSLVFTDAENMMREGEKALNDCKALIIKNIPKAFNVYQKWVVRLMLWKAFNGACLMHIRSLVSRNGFGTMSAERFLRYCQEETPRVMRAVSDDMSEEWQGKESKFPMPREQYEKHNYDTCAKECGEIIVNWFTICRQIKQKEQGVI